MSAYGTRCPQCVPCSAEDCEETAYCLSEPNRPPGPALCEDHDMYAGGGEYDAAADPFYVLPREDDGHTVWPPTTLPGALAESRDEVERWGAENGFDTTTNSYRWRRS